MKTWRMGALGFMSVVIAGCQEPTQIIPAVPPGTEYVRPVTDTGEALGEQAVHDRDQAALKRGVEKIPPAPPTSKGETKTTKSGVKYETLKEGTGPEARRGQTVLVQYTGMLENGEVFDSSRKPDGQPYTFIIGISPIIKGWTEGVPGMRVGERRKLVIPPDLAYGAAGNGKVPPNATLAFDIELLSIK